MSQWSITQWTALCSILVTAVSAIAACTRISFTVKAQGETIEKQNKRIDDLERECESHRNNSDIHRNKDYKDWIDSRFSGIEKKLDEILVEQKRNK